MNPSSGQALVAGRALVTATFYVCMRPTWIVEWMLQTDIRVAAVCATLKVRHRARFEKLDDMTPHTFWTPWLRR